jgi:hypothetical protein
LSKALTPEVATDSTKTNWSAAATACCSAFDAAWRMISAAFAGLPVPDIA